MNLVVLLGVPNEKTPQRSTLPVVDLWGGKRRERGEERRGKKEKEGGLF